MSSLSENRRFVQEAWDLGDDEPRLVAAFTDPDEAADYAEWRGCVELVPTPRTPDGECE